MKHAFAAAAVLFLSATLSVAEPVKVSVANFVRAETDNYMVNLLGSAPLGQFIHNRTPVSLDAQTVIRMNLDTLYSSAVIDLAAGPATVTVPPQADGRYVAVEVISQDHYAIDVLHEGARTYSQDNVGTRYAVVLLRVFVDARSPDDIKAANAVQDSVTIAQAAPGSLEVPEYDQASLKATREAILALAALGTEGMGRRMGRKDEVDPIAHLLATASGWGLNPETEAIYVFGMPERNDGTTVTTMTLKDVPVDGFWSVTVYDKDGFMAKNDLGVNAINNVNGTKGEDGSYVLQFGGCDGAVPNCIPVTEGWNYTIRLYRPHPEVVNGTWTAPEVVVKG
jgi:hypothetical protein